MKPEGIQEMMESLEAFDSPRDYFRLPSSTPNPTAKHPPPSKPGLPGQI